jgi:hypothetical protein
MGLQAGLDPVHRVVFVAEHCSHRPLRQAGSAAFEHCKLLPEPWSPLHVAHTPVAALQTGAVAGQLVVASQPHFCWATRHVGVTPTHADAFVAVHWTQRPLAQAGVVDVGHAYGAFV